MSNVDKLKIQPFKHESIDTMNWYYLQCIVVTFTACN